MLRHTLLPLITPVCRCAALRHFHAPRAAMLFATPHCCAALCYFILQYAAVVTPLISMRDFRHAFRRYHMLLRHGFYADSADEAPLTLLRAYVIVDARHA